MPKDPRWTAPDAERELLKHGFTLVRSRGSHRIYMKKNVRVVVPYHGHRILHPKIIRQVMRAIGLEDSQ